MSAFEPEQPLAKTEVQPQRVGNLTKLPFL